jgi:hypothetical protein
VVPTKIVVLLKRYAVQSERNQALPLPLVLHDNEGGSSEGLISITQGISSIKIFLFTCDLNIMSVAQTRESRKV